MRLGEPGTAPAPNVVTRAAGDAPDDDLTVMLSVLSRA